MPEVWIQLENRDWDLCPNSLGIDRMMGQTAQQRTGVAPELRTLTSPVTGNHHDQTMFQRLPTEALLYRRYTPNWAAPDDRKVNPWDLNEPDPTDTGTMGTIPGPVIEMNVGDLMTVHFRNLDMRTRTVTTIQELEIFPTVEGVFQPFPFFPPIDIDEFVANVTTVPLDPLKRTHSVHPHGVVFAATSDGAYPLSPPDAGNLVPVGPVADPIVEMDRVAWTTAGFAEGAPKQGDRVPPGGTFTYTWQTLGWPTTAGVWLYHDHSICDDDNIKLGAIGIIVVHNPEVQDPGEVIVTNADFPGGSPNGSPIDGTGHYLTPPNAKAQYLQLYHFMTGAGMLINGRKYLGQTPTIVAGQLTRMRFGIVGMGSDTHTFHLHGHRWVIPVAAGTALNANSAIPNPMVNIASQFEDTRVFGPANSFVFTIQEGSSFMRAEPPFGEWHMHCHVLDHMNDGMMGSLLVVKNGDPAVVLPRGVPCPPDAPMAGGGMTMVDIGNDFFNPANVAISRGSTVRWTNKGFDKGHTVTANGHPGEVFKTCMPVSTDDFDSGPLATNATFDHTFGTTGTFAYHCDIHGCGMAGTVTVA